MYQESLKNEVLITDSDEKIIPASPQIKDLKKIINLRTKSCPGQP